MDFDTTGKVSLEHIYTQPDPRAYFSTLRELEYQIPQLAKPYFAKIIDERREECPDRPLRVLDIGCSYGVNAALLKFDVSMDDLYERYDRHDQARSASPRETLVAEDQALARTRAGQNDIEVIGLDSSRPALDYALDAGFLDSALHADLESRDPTAPEQACLADLDLVISTGCLGYVTDRTIARVIASSAAGPGAPRDGAESGPTGGGPTGNRSAGNRPAGSGPAGGGPPGSRAGAGGGPASGPRRGPSGRLPWMAHFALRMFPFDPIEQTLARFGYETVSTDRLFEQRRFASRREQDQVLATLADVGVDPSGLEADGWLYAQLFVSRPRSGRETNPAPAPS